MIHAFGHRAGIQNGPYKNTIPIIIGLFVLSLCMSTMLSAHAAENTTSTALAPAAVTTPPSEALQPSFAARGTVQAFVKSMHQKHGIDQQKLLGLLADCHTNRKVLALMDKQYEALPWYKYEARVVTPTRIQEGVAFWKLHAKTLKDIQRIYGVSPEIIVSILGIETSYGKIMGSFNVLETLSTLAFDYPRRAPFFKKELEQLFLLAQEGALDLATAKGSYAGAMGMPQFMPSSYRQYAIDFSGKGQRDLLKNTEDVLGSVAYYLRKHGWQSGKAIIQPLRQAPTPMRAAVAKKNKIRNITLKSSEESEIYYRALPNFSVIMCYNNSTHYAMAVTLLSQEIRKAYTRSKGVA